MSVRFCWHYDPFSFLFPPLQDSPGATRRCTVHVEPWGLRPTIACVFYFVLMATCAVQWLLSSCRAFAVVVVLVMVWNALHSCSPSNTQRSILHLAQCTF